MSFLFLEVDAFDSAVNIARLIGLYVNIVKLKVFQNIRTMLEKNEILFIHILSFRMLLERID